MYVYSAFFRELYVGSIEYDVFARIINMENTTDVGGKRRYNNFN